MTILEVKDITYSYLDGKSERYILDNITYKFQTGTFYSVLGESGSGKTTFISLIASLDKPKSGSISFEGVDINEMGVEEYRRKHMGIIFQEYNLIPYMSGVQNVLTSLSLTNKNATKDDALELLKMVGISHDVAKRSITTMSGGEKQRIAIARALVGDKKVIIADEPTGNLDKDTSQTIMDIFCDLAHNYQKCVIMVTHSLELAAQSDIELHLDASTRSFIEKKYK